MKEKLYSQYILNMLKLTEKFKSSKAVKNMSEKIIDLNHVSLIK